MPINYGPTVLCTRSGYHVRCVRADSGFYADNFLGFLEERPVPYIVVARLIRPENLISRDPKSMASPTSTRQ